MAKEWRGIKGSRKLGTRSSTAFVNENLEFREGAKMSTEEVYRLYEDWVRRQGGTVPQVKMTVLGKVLKREIPGLIRRQDLDERGLPVSVYVNLSRDGRESISRTSAEILDVDPGKLRAATEDEPGA